MVGRKSGLTSSSMAWGCEQGPPSRALPSEEQSERETGARWGRLLLGTLVVCSLAACSAIRVPVPAKIPFFGVTKFPFRAALVVPPASAEAIHEQRGIDCQNLSDYVVEIGHGLEAAARTALVQAFETVEVVKEPASALDRYDVVVEVDRPLMTVESTCLTGKQDMKVDLRLRGTLRDREGHILLAETYPGVSTKRIPYAVPGGIVSFFFVDTVAAREIIQQSIGEVVGEAVANALGGLTRGITGAPAFQAYAERRLAPAELPSLAPGSTASDANPRDIRVEGKIPAAYVGGHYGQAWAVVIGIDQYRADIPRLHYAVADAQAMGDALAAQGFRVIRLLNEQATAARIRGVLGDELPQQLKAEDRLLVFYAGHGETRTIEGGRAMGYLLPVDASREGLHRTALNMGEVRELADLVPAKHVLFLVDVCYGGIAGQQYRSVPKQTAAYLKQITRERGRQVITAGGPGQRVVEGPQWGHSVFTYYLLEGLTKGLADLNGDGVIPVSELYAYLDGRVPVASENQQRPELWSLAAEKGEFVFLPADAPRAGR